MATVDHDKRIEILQGIHNFANLIRFDEKDQTARKILDKLESRAEEEGIPKVGITHAFAQENNLKFKRVSK